jgi:transcription initiation factor TFIIIB Brf1 subunit/transcription initiation factor TFIIB
MNRITEKTVVDDLFQSFQEEIEKEERKEEKKVFIDKKKSDVCMHCHEPHVLINDHEMIICSHCGAENNNIIDYQAEWRFYGCDDNKRSSDPNRCGIPMNPLLKESSLSTVLLGKGFEVYRKLNSWNGLTYKERSLISILNKIAQKANIDNVPQSIIDATIQMYKMISENYIKRGDSREGLIAACFSNALRDQGLIRSTEEIAKLFEIKTTKLSKACNEFTELMYSKNKDYVRNIKPIDSKEMVERFGKLMNYDDSYIELSCKVIGMVEKLGICQENNPKSIAVGCLYLISQYYELGYTKKYISESCKTSEVTVSNTYNQMLKVKEYILPNKIK